MEGERGGERDVPTNSETVEELESEGLGLSDGGETTVSDLLSVELERVLGVLESLLNESGQLTDTTTLLAENVLGVGGTDDDLDCQSSQICNEMGWDLRGGLGRTSVRA